MKIYACPKCGDTTLEPLFESGVMDTCFICLECDHVFTQSEAKADEVSALPEGAIEVGTTILPYDVDTD